MAKISARSGSELARWKATMGGRQGTIYTFVLRSDGSVIHSIDYGNGVRDGYKLSGLKFPPRAMAAVRIDPHNHLVSALRKRGYEAVR